MIEIDLLKGGGLPAKSKPGLVALGSLPFLLPLVGAVALAGLYRSDRVLLQSADQKAAMCSRRIEDQASTQAYVEAVQAEQEASSVLMGETAALVGRHLQFSPVLMALIESVPDGVTLLRFQVIRREVRTKVPKADDPRQTVDVTAYQYILEVAVRAESDDAAPIQKFIQSLKGSAVLAEKLEDVRLASQRPVETEDETFVQYDIECVFQYLR